MKMTITFSAYKPKKNIKTPVRLGMYSPKIQTDENDPTDYFGEDDYVPYDIQAKALLNLLERIDQLRESYNASGIFPYFPQSPPPARPSAAADNDSDPSASLSSPPLQ